jgi:hypothetical protein
VLDDRDVTAGLTKYAEPMFLAEGSSCRFFKYLYKYLPNIIAQPLIENSAKEIAEGISRYGPVA